MPQCPRQLESYISMKTCNSGVLIKMPLCSNLLLCVLLYQTSFVSTVDSVMSY
jgi:hypothetical protein